MRTHGQMASETILILKLVMLDIVYKLLLVLLQTPSLIRRCCVGVWKLGVVRRYLIWVTKRLQRLKRCRSHSNAPPPS